MKTALIFFCAKKSADVLEPLKGGKGFQSLAVAAGVSQFNFTLLVEKAPRERYSSEGKVKI